MHDPSAPNRSSSPETRSPHARSSWAKPARDTSREPPLPIRECPWCGTSFAKHSFRLEPDAAAPTDLKVRCASRRCDFNARRPLPIVAVDEPIYARVPCFMIATADKFAALPWSGETAEFFRGGDPANPRPPDLIIQDELHLISGPLGTMAGLYETAIDHLCTRRIGEKLVRPKIIASTATVRLANKQNQGTVQSFGGTGVPRSGYRPARLVLRQGGHGGRIQRTALSRDRRARRRTEGDLPPQHDHAARSGAGRVGRVRQEGHQPGRSVHDRDHVLQRVAGTRKRTTHRRRRDQRPPAELLRAKPPGRGNAQVRQSTHRLRARGVDVSRQHQRGRRSEATARPSVLAAKSGSTSRWRPT